MEVAMPMTGNAIDSYEDMFKEITRKLYGEDGLPELTGSSERPHPASSDRGLTPIDYDVDTPILKPEEHLTAFGLAALMQNGFPSPFQQHKPNPNYEDKWIISEDSIPWTPSKIASYNPSQKLFRCAECDCVGYLPRVAEHWLGTHSNLRVFQCPQCPYESAWARCVRMHLTRQHNIDTEETSDALLKNNPVLQELTRYLQRLKTRLEATCAKNAPPPSSSSSIEEYHPPPVSGAHNRQITAAAAAAAAVPQAPETSSSSSSASNPAASKRYTCTYCPYATDRRDLFTRHENIHREEKPFQCYVCQKQFNRADHVKKHFLRMHREHVYDLNRIRRHPPKNASGMSYYQKYNSTPPDHDHHTDGGGGGSAGIPANVVNPAISIPHTFNTTATTRNLTSNVRNHGETKVKAHSVKTGSGSAKKKGEKRFSCCYCSWSGVDNWCLKRHMNTHLKPFVCGLCDYKAARSERLATHVLKVHNKRACSKCTFLADDQQQLAAHQAEQHPMEHRNNRNTNTTNSNTSGNVLRNTSFVNSTVTSTNSFGGAHALKSHDISAAAALLHGNHRLLPPDVKHWKPHVPKQHGAARLFNYLEASDGSEPECDSSCGPADMSRLSHRVQSDFPEAGDVGRTHHDDDDDHDDNSGESELPLFVCPVCGCEFEDDRSLETHQLAHRRATSPARQTQTQKENINPTTTKCNYTCTYCNTPFANQATIIRHMKVHLSLFGDAPPKRPRPNKIANGVLKDSPTPLRRKRYFCVKCKALRVFRNQHNLHMHNYWSHNTENKVRFQCEHCNLFFHHKYQMILHSSKVHIKPFGDLKAATTSDQRDPGVPGGDHLNQGTIGQQLPELGTAAGMHKIGMYFDSFHSNIHSNHMPLIIPTFPPN